MKNEKGFTIICSECGKELKLTEETKLDKVDDNISTTLGGDICLWCEKCDNSIRLSY